MSYNSVEELEEGEILEEPPVSQKSVEKVLPRRYVLHENKSFHYKHKKTCKHAVHCVKKSTKFTKTPVKLKDPYKKHHKSCRHATTSKHTRRRISPVKENSINSNINAKNEANFSSHSLYVEMKSNFKNCTRSIGKIQVPRKLKSENSHASLGIKKCTDNKKMFPQQSDIRNSELNGGFKSTNSSSKDLNENCDSVEINDNDEMPNYLKEEPCEESEDEEELRRKALASCIKRTLPSESSADENDKDKALSLNLVSESQAIDNYEVIDMEVDDEEEISDDKLFMIDKNPAQLLPEELENIKPGLGFSKRQNIPSSQVDIDFEEELLRAEVISSMVTHKKLSIIKDQIIRELPEENKVNCPSPSQKTVHKPIVKKMTAFVRKPFKNPQKPGPVFVSNDRNTLKVPVFARKHIKSPEKSQPVIVNIGKRTVRKVVALPRKPVKSIQKPEFVAQKRDVVEPQRVVINEPQRVVINVGETSTDESDQEEVLNRQEIDKENAVASIEALISDARQKSDETNAQNKVNNIPNAVACLSKAQQEEYNSLLKLLAQKNKVPLEPKKPTSVENLKLLEKKFIIAETNLQKEKLALSNMEKEFSKQKDVYIKSRKTVLYLKEKLQAAERIRKLHLKSIRTMASQLGIIRNTVSSREMVVNELKNKCSKLGSSMQGQTYALPPTSSDIPPHINAIE